MDDVVFKKLAFEEYLYWQTQDKKTLKRINAIIKDISRNENNGIGKSEALRGNLSGFWSRRIDEKNRLIYKIVDNKITIYNCKGHYDDK